MTFSVFDEGTGVQFKAGFTIAKTGRGAALRWKGNPVAMVLVVLLLAWLLLDAAVGFDYLRDHHAGYRGQVVDIHNTWYDWVTLEFTPVEHLVIQTPDGKRQDRLVTQANRLLQRIQPGDQVVKERGFGNYPHVPGKLTAQQMLEANNISSP